MKIKDTEAPGRYRAKQARSKPIQQQTGMS